jgi:toxin-antitoxin system PIN domain toxin
VSAALLDVSVLVALLWPSHSSHLSAQAWFARHARHGWATCPITQAGFVRILSVPLFSPDAYTPAAATRLLQMNLEHPDHQFWPDDVSLFDSLAHIDTRLQGHKQITDAYLLGLTLHHKGRFITADRSLTAMLPKGAPSNSLVVI